MSSGPSSSSTCDPIRRNSSRRASPKEARFVGLIETKNRVHTMEAMGPVHQALGRFTGVATPPPLLEYRVAELHAPWRQLV